MKSSIANGSKQEFIKQYYSALKYRCTKGQISMLNHFWTNPFATPRGQAMYLYIKVVKILAFPVSFVLNVHFREISKPNEPLSIKSLNKTVFALHEIVETQIRKEMQGTHGALIHDGWTKNGTFYFGVIASYMKSLTRLSYRKVKTELELALPLLSVSPLAHRDEN